jgi:hypothetical protein
MKISNNEKTKGKYGCPFYSGRTGSIKINLRKKKILSDSSNIRLASKTDSNRSPIAKTKLFNHIQ